MAQRRVTALLKRFRPVTPSLRGTVLLDQSHLWKGRPVAKLTHGLRKTGGRNHKGRITVWGRGGGHKRLYRQIDFERRDTQGIVQTIEYDPNRSANIANVLNWVTGEQRYILAPVGLKVGDLVRSGDGAEIKTGHALTLADIPLGQLIHNVGLTADGPGVLIRAAGAAATIIAKDAEMARLRLPSGEQRMIPLQATATIGQVSNDARKLVKIGKAGRNRWLGKRPTVRGVAMNPVDHPHGGGEGKTSGGRPSVTPWGKPTKGQPTKSEKKRSKHVVLTVRQAKRKTGSHI